jgi:hypothetical protein
LKKLNLLYGLLVVCFACKKEPLPKEITGVPELGIMGFLDGQPFKMEAGVQGYYLDAYYLLDDQDVYVHGASLSSVEAQGGALEFVIRGSSQGAGVIDSSLQKGQYPYRTPIGVDTAFQVQFSSVLFKDDANTQFNWNFGDQSFSTERNPIHTYSGSEQKKYRVCLNALITPDSCFSSLCTDIVLPGALCNASFNYSINDTVNFMYDAVPLGRAPFEYDWQFNGDVGAVSKKVDYCYKSILPDGVDKACVTIKDANDCSTMICQNIAVFPNNVSCMVNLTYTVQPISVFDSLDLSTVEIHYTAPNGERYSSRNDVQSVQDYFDVLDVETYKTNRNGEKTKRLVIQGRCTLYSSLGRSMLLVIDKGAIALAYP